MQAEKCYEDINNLNQKRSFDSLIDYREIHTCLETCFDLFTMKLYDITDVRVSVFRKPTQLNACGRRQVTQGIPEEKVHNFC